MLTNIWKTHDSSQWQDKFYQWDSKSLIEAQFLLATSKPNSHWQQSNPNSYWQHQSPILIGNNQSPILISNNQSPILIGNNQSLIFINTTLSKKEKSLRLSKLGNIYIYIYHVTKARKAHCKYSWRNPKKKCVFTNKSPWGIKTHGNMRTQLSPCE